MGTLALNGGEKIRTAPFQGWPIFGKKEEDALLEVCRSGKWGLGLKVEEFERQFAAFQDAKYGICMTSGTAALEIALLTVGVKPGDEVIIPPYTFIATASAVIMVGAIPIFVDVEPDTYNLDPAQIEEAITEKTVAIVPVHIGGRPADLDAIMEMAQKHDLRVIEDACQAHASEWKGTKVGAIADIGAFSFQASKNLNAGEGGILLTNDKELEEIAWSLHNCGRIRAGAWYEHHRMGWNCRMTEFQAAILLAQIEDLEAQSKKRWENAVYLTELLDDIDGISTMKKDPRVTANAYHLYIFRYHPERFGGAPKKRFIEALNAEGIPASPGYGPLYKEIAFKAGVEDLPFESAYFKGEPDYSQVSCPVTERICQDEALWLKQSIFLGTKEDMEDIAGAVRKVQEHCHELMGAAAVAD